MLTFTYEVKKMISRLSARLAGALENGGAIRAEDRDIYVYGLEILLSSAANALIVLAAGLLLGKLPETILFMLFFAVLRGTAGGYHADTHAACILIMAVAYGAAMVVLTLLPSAALPWFSLCAAVTSVIAVLAFAPAPHENKPISGKELLKFRKLSVCISFGEAGVVALLAALNAANLGAAAALGMLASAASLFAACIKDMSKKRAI
jgi:accessory gene regulator B